MFCQIVPKHNSVGSLFAERLDLNSGFKDDFISSRLFNERSCDTFPTIGVISATICAIVCISKFSFCTSVKIFRAHATTLTNDFCSVANFTSPLLWLENIILQSPVLTNGIDKGQLLGSKMFFSLFPLKWFERFEKQNYCK